jgi:hypothetical protein
MPISFTGPNTVQFSTSDTDLLVPPQGPGTVIIITGLMITASGESAVNVQLSSTPSNETIIPIPELPQDKTIVLPSSDVGWGNSNQSEGITLVTPTFLSGVLQFKILPGSSS